MDGSTSGTAIPEGGQKRLIVRPPTVLFVISEDWNVVSHFLPVIRAAKSNGFDVLVATRVYRSRAEIESVGASVLPFNTDPRSPSGKGAFRFVLELAALIKREKPDVIYCVSIRTCMVGGVAARLAGARNLVLAPTGLGHLWIVDNGWHRIVRGAVRLAFNRLLPWGCQIRYIFENDDDPAEVGLGAQSKDIVIVGGAGVDPGAFPYTPEPPAQPVKVAVVARMTRQKGIAESIAAVQLVRAAGADVELHIFGSPDPANPSSFSSEELQAMVAAKPWIFWHGQVEDQAKLWQEHHIALLLSLREGLPRSLVEAAASGRPIVTTNVVGCRRVVRDGIDGFLVEVGDIEATASALLRLAQSPALRNTMGLKSRERFEELFTEAGVRETVGGVFRDLARSIRPPFRCD